VKLRELFPSWRRARQLRARVPATTSKPLPVIVSLTSIPSRLPYVDLPIRSVLEQTRPPELVVLWLHESLRAEIPPRLAALVGARVEIRYVSGTSSHRKLVHTIAEWPDRVIVTCDDDVMYDPQWLERLWTTHLRHPRDVIAHEGRLIGHGADGSLLPYAQWPWVQEPGLSLPSFLPVGYGGALYPPGTLHPDVTDAQQYLALAPSADDLWFKAMALRAGTVSRRTDTPVPRPIPVIGAKGSALAAVNIREDRNRKQWLALCEAYGLGRLDGRI
jgi:hypothetical protein